MSEQIANRRLTVSGNHSLAGKRCRVRIRIHELRDPEAAGLEQGAAGSATASPASQSGFSAP